jgi:hypothetical protein
MPALLLLPQEVDQFLHHLEVPMPTVPKPRYSPRYQNRIRGVPEVQEEDERYAYPEDDLAPKRKLHRYLPNPNFLRMCANAAP